MQVYNQIKSPSAAETFYAFPGDKNRFQPGQFNRDKRLPFQNFTHKSNIHKRS